MAEDPKKGKPGNELDDWASAIDEWDANLSLPSPTGKVPKFDASELAEAAADAELEAQPIAEIPSRPSDEITPIPESLDARDVRDLPDAEEEFEEAAITPPPFHAPPPTPVPGSEPRAFEPSQPLPLPLEAPPLYAEPTAADDPLMNLFEGDMELPDEAGQALGSLLGAQEGKTMIASAAVIQAALDVPDDGPGLYSEEEDAFGGGSTRVASADEFDKLLADTALVGDGEDVRPGPPPVQPQLAIADPGTGAGRVVTIEPSYPSQGGFAHESTRVAGGAELNELLANDADLEATLPEPPSSAPRPSPLLPEPGSKLASGRFSKPSERLTTIPSPPTAPQPKKAAPAPIPQPPQRPLRTAQQQQQIDDDEDLEVEMEVSPAVDAPFDDDFYDDIEVVHAVDALAQAVAQAPVVTPATTAAAAAAGDDEELFDLSVEPSMPLNAGAVSSDPDRTPLPVADSDVESSQPAAPSQAAAPSQPLATGESRPVVATRIVAPSAPLPTLVVPELAPAQPLDAAYLRDQLALYDTERLLAATDDPARIARLAFAAGRAAERLGDVAGALERYQATLDADPQHAHALRGLRRLRLSVLEGQRDPALLAIVDREIAGAAAAEKRGLIGIKAELALAAGEEEAARAAYAAILAEQPGDLSALTGLVDLAASGSDEDLAAALGEWSAALGNTVDPATRAALLVERGRLDEAAERVPNAVARFKEALDVDPTAAAAAWGLLRVAVRTPGIADDLDTHARLIDLLPAGALKQALSRRLGVLRARQNDFAAARPPLQAAAADGDRLALLDLSQLERADNRLDEAATALARAADAEPDAGRRADRLMALGELHEKQGNTAQAAAAYQRAASEYPDDPRAARALERTQAAGGDKESALRRHLAAAERSPARAPMELTYAARLLRELGRGDEALARLSAALTTAPTFAPAIDLAVELHLAATRPEEAALVLTRASEAVDEPGLALAHRMRATRLLLRNGRPNDALAIVRPLLGADGLRAARWLEQRILRQTEGQGEALRESLRAEAESAELIGDRPRAAAIAYELGISAVADDEALDLLRRVVAAEPLDGAAAAEIVARLDDERRGVEIPALLQARLQSAQGRAEAVGLALRLGAALLEDARDPAAAERAYADAAQWAPGYAPAREGLDRVARYSDDSATHLAALERERQDSPLAEQRFAIEMLTGEQLERAQGSPEKAAERYRLALAERPHHPVARQALERAYEAARNHSALADLALADLKEAPDPQAKVAAYERLAYIDGELRGDRQSALLGWESILEVDHANHTAMRILEKHYLLEQRWPELVALYEQMGLTAVDPAFAVAVHLDRARLRKRVGEVTDEERAAAVANDYRLALFKDPRSRTALRHVYARARAARDLLPMAETAAALAEAAGDDPRTSAVMLTRAAESLVELDRAEEARARYEAAVQLQPGHLPALLGLGDFALAKGEWAVAAHAAERAAALLREPAEQARLYLVAGALAQDKLGDSAQAQALLRQSLVADPRGTEPFMRLEQLLAAANDYSALAEHYQQRLAVETDGGRLLALHLQLARIARDQLKDPDRARAELKAVLAQDPTHAEALQALADLQFEGQQWADAAETLIRRARAEKSRLALKDIFFKLGIIYSQHLPDPKRAVASFTRVLQVTPDDLVALEHLSDLHLKEWEWKGALQATLRLAELETDKAKRIAHLHRVAKIYEEGFKDARHALEALRRALELDPLYLPSVGELSKFFDRQSDVQSMRVHLDRTAARVRLLLDANPLDPVAYHALFKVFNWRRAPDRAAVTAGVLDWLDAVEADERVLLAKLTGRDNYPGTALADPTLDETLFDARVPAGFRNLFRLLDEPLAKMFRADVKRLGVGRHEKLPRSGHALRDAANKIAADLGVRDFDLYVTAAHPTALVVELTDPLSVVIGSRVVEGAHEMELRFILGRCFKMIQSHMALPMRLTPEDLGLLVGGIVRQFVPDFVPQGFEEPQIVAEAGRMARIIPKKMHSELLPFALECASESLDLKLIGPSLVHTANRAGLLTCGLPGPSLTAVKRLADEAQLRALLRFTVSDELAELRRQLGTAIG